jgi:hypothetical protein
MLAAVIDIGKPGKNLGWSFGKAPNEGTDLDECIEELAAALANGGLALGFEAPMFVPRRQKPAQLLAARCGECRPGKPNRPFSAGAGATVLVTGLVVVPYVLSKLKSKVPDASATLDWRAPITKKHLLLFEAFVTDQRKSTESRHVEDARLAVAAFKHGMKNPANLKSSVTVPDCFNLLGAMMLRTDWSIDPEVLRKPCLVIRADAPPVATFGDDNAP